MINKQARILPPSDSTDVTWVLTYKDFCTDVSITANALSYADAVLVLIYIFPMALAWHAECEALY